MILCSSGTSSTGIIKKRRCPGIAQNQYIRVQPYRSGTCTRLVLVLRKMTALARNNFTFRFVEPYVGGEHYQQVLLFIRITRSVVKLGLGRLARPAVSKS
jgi:hypothetical protein